MRPEISDIPEDMIELMKKFNKKINKTTEKILSPYWIPNIKKNVEYFKDLKENSLLLLKNKHKGSAPVYLIGAGPSLKENIKELKKKKRR